MLKMALIPAVVLASTLAVAAPVTAFEQQETERVDKTASIRAGGTLKVKNFSGRVTITGSRRSDVAVHAVRRAPRERLDHIKLEVVETSSGVTIEANKKDSEWRDRDNNVVDTQLEILVPEDVRLDVEVFSSDVKVENVTGNQKLHTFSGTIDITGATGSVDAETFSGDIELGLGQGVGGRFDFDTFSGDLRSEVGLTTRSASRKRVSGLVGTGGNNDYSFKTFSGDVRIR
jgi:putative adhesin